MRVRFLRFGFVGLLGWAISLPAAAPGTDLHVACDPRNDLLLALKAAGAKVTRHDKPAQAVAAAAAGSGVLLLADSYAAEPLQVSEDVFQLAANKKLRLYVEFAAAVPGV